MKWLPLESNPEVMNKFIHELGAELAWNFTDIFGLDEELLAMVPKPINAVLLLFPITEKYEKARLEEEKEISEKSQSVSSNVFFVKQTIGNACGTIGLIHALCNNSDRIQIDGFFKEFLEKTKHMSKDERAEELEKSEKLSIVHNNLALEGQSNVPDLDADINLHFICFVERDGSLYELDGRRPFPINRGPSSNETFLQDAAKVIQKFIERDPENINFNVVGLVGAPVE